MSGDIVIMSSMSLLI